MGKRDLLRRGDASQLSPGTTRPGAHGRVPALLLPADHQGARTGEGRPAAGREGRSMHLTEQHVIDRKDPRFAVIDAAAFASKNLYNAANYEIRQAFFHEGTYLNYHEVQRRMQSHEAYKALPAKISQQVLLQLHHDWESFFKACAAYEESPSKFLGRPRLPKYKHKTEGRNILVYTIQAISKRGLKR